MFCEIKLIANDSVLKNVNVFLMSCNTFSNSGKYFTLNHFQIFLDFLVLRHYIVSLVDRYLRIAP